MSQDPPQPPSDWPALAELFGFAPSDPDRPVYPSSLIPHPSSLSRAARNARLYTREIGRKRPKAGA